MMYESPITLLRTQTDNFVKEVNEKTDEVIFKAVVNVFPQVNKEELIKALEYDRGQYIKGYQDRDKEIVRCKDCKWYMLTDHNETEVCTNKQWDISMAVYPIISADGFCSYGERGDNSYGERAEQTEYKLPGHDEVMEALDKLTIRKVTDKDETEYLNRTFRHDDGEWHDLTDTLKGKPRLVDANDLMDNLPCLKNKKLDCDFCSFYKNKTSECLLEKWIGNAHTVSARPHGEWIRNELWGMPFYRCSVCGFHGQKDFDFCPACGNEMIGESEDK